MNKIYSKKAIATPQQIKIKNHGSHYLLAENHIKALNFDFH